MYVFSWQTRENVLATHGASGRSAGQVGASSSIGHRSEEAAANYLDGRRPCRNTKNALTKIIQDAPRFFAHAKISKPTHQDFPGTTVGHVKRCYNERRVSRTCSSVLLSSIMIDPECIFEGILMGFEVFGWVF